jgi:uncharacterized protein YutE (UPF0331/DUF86 family)
MTDRDRDERAFPLMQPRDILTPTATLLALSVASIALIISIMPQNPNIVRNFAAIMIGVVILFISSAVTTSLATFLRRQWIWRTAIGLYIIGWVYMAGVLLILFVGYATGIEFFQLPKFDILTGLGIPLFFVLILLVELVWMLRHRETFMRGLEILLRIMRESMDAVSKERVGQETKDILAIEKKDAQMSVVKTVIEIERRLREIATSLGYEPRHIGASQLAQVLFKKGVIEERTMQAITEVWKVRNYVVHGYGISKRDATAALDLAMTVLVTLKEMQEKPRT